MSIMKRRFWRRWCPFLKRGIALFITEKVGIWWVLLNPCICSICTRDAVKAVNQPSWDLVYSASKNYIRNRIEEEVCYPTMKHKSRQQTTAGTDIISKRHGDPKKVINLPMAESWGATKAKRVFCETQVLMVAFSHFGAAPRSWKLWPGTSQYLVFHESTWDEPEYSMDKKQKIPKEQRSQFCHNDHFVRIIQQLSAISNWFLHKINLYPPRGPWPCNLRGITISLEAW
jgi:hypothetical protein